MKAVDDVVIQTLNTATFEEARVVWVSCPFRGIFGEGTPRHRLQCLRLRVVDDH